MVRKKKETAGISPDVMKEMRERYERAVDAERDQRDLALQDLKFVSIPGEQWDPHMKALRKKRPCYEFNILRSHVRQVCNDQKKARPSIKVRPVENGDTKGAELRQGLIRNIEQTSNADRAYDTGHETLVAGGFGAWLVKTEYSSDDAWDQDIRIAPIEDAINSVWLDPDDWDDPSFGFIEQSMSRAAFRAKYPKADEVSFESSRSWDSRGWCGQDEIRVVAYYRKVEHKKTILLLSDGRSVDAEEVKDTLDELAEQGITVLNDRVCHGHKVVTSICSGLEEIDGPYETVFHKVPIVTIYANRQKIEGKVHYCGMVRFSRDPQKLVNFNLTTAMESVAKVPKSPYLVTPKMLEGAGVKEAWASAGAQDPYFLAYTPDPSAPGGKPFRENPPDVPAALLQLAATSVDMLKATDNIHDASLGARSNETSGRAIRARQEEGDTATYDFQDSLRVGIQKTGDLILRALPKVYDTPRIMRVIGKDGTEKLETLYQEELDRDTGRMVKTNDLSVGKYDLTVTAGANYDTQRMEFVDTMQGLMQANPMVAQAAPDLLVKHMDFHGADEVSERLKLMLPPPIQQAIAQGKPLPPEVTQAMQQAEGMMQQAQQMAQAVQQAGMALEQEKAGTEAQKKELEASRKEFEAAVKVANAELKLAVAEAQTKASAAQASTEASERDEQTLSAIADIEARAAAVAQQAVNAAAQVTEALQLLAEHRAGQVIKGDVPERKQITMIRDPQTGLITGGYITEVENG